MPKQPTPKQPTPKQPVPRQPTISKQSSPQSSAQSSSSAHPIALRVVGPLTPGQLARVEGTLGSIVTRRATAYADAPLTAALSSGYLRPSFFSALTAMDELSIIAEIKQRSPSQGALATLAPAAAATAYYRGGAAALSVLTEAEHFGGCLEDLVQASNVVPIPTLRKDFVVHPYQLYEAKAAGASAVLLIVAVLQEALADYIALANALELDALVEVHDEAELEHAIAASANIVGVNNRDLRSLAVDLTNAPRLLQRAKAMGFEGVLVAESGYQTRADLAPLAGLADAVLVGTALVRKSANLTQAVADLLEH